MTGRAARAARRALALLAASAVAVAAARAESPVTGPFEKIVVAGERPGHGLFDPSIEYDDAGTGWLAYSRVVIPKHVETHLAKSTDRGRTWTYAGAANRSTDDVALIEGVAHTGAWRYETPALVFDPRDVPARRWKLFAQRYFVVAPYGKGDSRFAHGWIALAHAADPAGPWSEPACLFGKQAGCRVDPTTLHPDLAGYAFFNELGAIVVDGTLYLSMDASATASGLGEWERRKIVLVASRDHGDTWTYAGTLTRYRDARALGYRVLTGSSLVREGGRLFLLVTPSGATGLFAKNRDHDGTLVVELEDIARARPKRDARGELVVLKTFKPDLRSGGLSDHDEQNTAGGILFAQIDLRMPPEFFRIFSTKRRLLGDGAAADAARR